MTAAPSDRAEPSDALGGLPAFYAREGEALVPTALCRGPWSPLHQHGGPPAALLGGAIERLARGGGAADARVVRMTVELLRPVPLEPLRVEARLLKDGRKALLCGASLFTGDRELARASAAAVRTVAVELPPSARPPLPAHQAAPPPPASLPPFELALSRDALGYHRAMELRMASGGPGRGTAVAWMRMRCPLVAGEAPSPLERILCAADSTQGLSMGLDVRAYTFVNADLTVYVQRPLEGEWVGFDARSVAEADGTGLSDALLWDAAGPVGRALQGLVVERRAAPRP